MQFPEKEYQARRKSCTTILVGKEASLDGSPMIARNEDNGTSFIPVKFTAVAATLAPTVYQSALTGITVPAPGPGYSYTSTPDYSSEYGIWGGSGINEKNVAMTASETITVNPQILALDPFVADGLGEADFLTVTLPFIDSARAGVDYLGKLIETYGTYESNGIAFADADAVWYLETIGGHHWAAIRIPDDCYVIAPNRLNIDFFDFDSPDTRCSADLKSWIAKEKLNPRTDGRYNLREIFGTATFKDTLYNNPRAWYIQSRWNLPAEQPTDPEAHDLAFLNKPARKLRVEDLKWALSSHFEQTAFDPYGSGATADRQKYRPIALNRNQEVHVLQIRPTVPHEIAGIHWLAFGPNTFNFLVPFYSFVDTTPTHYETTTAEFDLQQSYWLHQLLGLLGDQNFARYGALFAEQEATTIAGLYARQRKSDTAFTATANPRVFLATANEDLAEYAYQQAHQLLETFVLDGVKKMTLQYGLTD